MKQAIPLLTAAALLLSCGFAQLNQLDELAKPSSSTITLGGAQWGINQATFGFSPSIGTTDTNLERVENTGDRLFIYYHQTGHTGEMCAVYHPPGDVCDYGKIDLKWREAYGIRDGKIAFLEKQFPKPVTTKQTNVTESTTYEYPNP